MQDIKKGNLIKIDENQLQNNSLMLDIGVLNKKMLKYIPKGKKWM